MPGRRRLANAAAETPIAEGSASNVTSFADPAVVPDKYQVLQWLGDRDRWRRHLPSVGFGNSGTAGAAPGGVCSAQVPVIAGGGLRASGRQEVADCSQNFYLTGERRAASVLNG